jgi:hypothetical protein
MELNLSTDLWGGSREVIHIYKSVLKTLNVLRFKNPLTSGPSNSLVRKYVPKLLTDNITYELKTHNSRDQPFVTSKQLADVKRQTGRTCGGLI